MKNNVVLNERDLKLKKRLFSVILYIIYPAYILHSCVISPLYTITDSNVAYKGIISLLLRFVYEVIDLFVIFLSLSVIIYGLCRLGLKNMRSSITVALLAPVFKYVLKIIVSPFIDGFVDLDQFMMDMYTLAISGGLEILQLTVILLLSYIGIKKYRERAEILSKAYDRLSDKSKVRYSEELLPFEKIVGMKNPLQRSAIISAAIVFAFRIAMHVINDLSTYANIVFNMLFFLPYILSLAAGVLGYLLMLYVFINIGLHDE